MNFLSDVKPQAMPPPVASPSTLFTSFANIHGWPFSTRRLIFLFKITLVMRAKVALLPNIRSDGAAVEGRRKAHVLECYREGLRRRLVVQNDQHFFPVGSH